MAEYRSMEHIRAEADCEYYVSWFTWSEKEHETDDQSPIPHFEKVIADDHECAKKQIEDRYPNENIEILLVLKGEILVLWQA